MKLAFVTPRYGGEISSGPEHACRLLAEQLSSRHDVDVLTTCARDETWKNTYGEGADRVRGVLVRRFAASQPGDADAYRMLAERLLINPHGRTEEMDWVRRAGPVSQGLIEHLKRQHRSYDAIVFFSLHHATTVQGINIAPDRSILFPYLQLTPALRLNVLDELFGAVRGIGYFSGSERRLARAFFRSRPLAEEVVGIGIETPPLQSYPRLNSDAAYDTAPDENETAASSGDGADEDGPVDYLAGPGVPFRRRNRLHGVFALHAGRVEPDNGCEELLEYFDSYAAADGDTALVLVGVKMMKVPDAPYLRMAGVVPDRDRMIAFEAADVTIMPSSSDLLAQPLLESFAVGTPVLASARNEAAVEHCRRANAGLYYANRAEFVEAMRRLMSDAPLRERLGANGRQYVRANHRWDAVIGRFERLLTRLPRR